MPGDILKIKVNIPPLVDPYTIDRPNILEKIKAGLVTGSEFSRPLTLISAPAGCGKTTLARQWLKGSENRAAWLSLDDRDNETERFWLYLVSALQTCRPEIGKGTLEILYSSTRETETQTGSETYLTSLLNDLFTLKEPLHLVIDDYHLIEKQAIHQGMIFFIENLPSNLHLVLATRSDPPWPLHRWRAKDKMREIRQTDLQLTKEETSRYINDIKELAISAPQLESLHLKTRGWITGLQLAAYSISNSLNKDEFIKHFTGSHQDIFQFLSEEVFRRQPEPVQNFLIQTAVLNRLCPSLCNALTGRADGEEMLATLNHKQLFVTPLDDPGTWFRYHPLFADLIRHQLQKTHPGKETEQHEKAAKWFLDAGEPGEALRHARSAGNLKQTAAILDRHFEQIMITEGSGLTRRCLEELSDHLLVEFPILLAYKALYRFVRQNNEEAAKLMQTAEILSYDDREKQQEFQGTMALLKMYFNFCENNISLALDYAETALQLLPAHTSFWRIYAAIISGDANFMSGYFNKAYPYLQKALQISRDAGINHSTVTAGFKLTHTLYYLGKLKEAEELARDILKFAAAHGFSKLPRVGCLWALLGEILREKGDLEEAESCIKRGLDISKPEKPFLGMNYLFSAALSFSRGDRQQILEVTDKIKELDRELGLPQFITIPAAAWEGRIYYERGNPAKAKEILAKAGITADSKVFFSSEKGYLTLARVLAGNADDNRDRIGLLLEKIEEFASSGGNQKHLLETRLLKSLLEEKIGRPEKAETLLLEALSAGTEAGYFQAFIDEGKELEPVLNRVLNKERNKKPLPENKELIEYTAEIHRVIKGEERPSGKKRKSPSPGQKTGRELVEELNARELEILKLLAEGYSNREISKELYLSVGTIKWYTSNIYGKLGARSRAEAVALAQKLDLLS